MKDELLGYKEIEDSVITCGDCGLKLIDVVVAETNQSRKTRGLTDISQRFIVTSCPRCQGSSFKTKIFEGTTVLGTIDKNYVMDFVDIDEEDGIFINTLVVRRK